MEFNPKWKTREDLINTIAQLETILELRTRQATKLEIEKDRIESMYKTISFWFILWIIATLIWVSISVYMQ